MKVGFGYDSHRFSAGRPLMLGGVEIPCEEGLLGHSDADVLLHAIGDALIGALGEGDLGRHFPDSDASLKDISSKTLLLHIRGMMEKKEYRINNIDTTIVIEKPRLAPHIGAMVRSIALLFDISEDAVNVKATTNEGMGFTGRGEGAAAFAVVTIAPL